MNPKGFTLIELLIVIAIIAILSVVVILTLNPAQLLAQSRDAQRLSDMATLKSAISLYLADQKAPSIGAAGNCYTSTTSTVAANCGGRSPGPMIQVTSLTPGSIIGNGWIPISFNAISSGSPIGQEPIDPVNSATYFYSYATNASPSLQFKLGVHMESVKYANGGPSDVESTDGGITLNAYETGTNLGL